MAHETAAEDRAARHAPSIVMRSDPLDRLERLAQFLADPLVGVEGQRLLKFSVYRVSASTLSRISNDHAQARSRLLRQLMSRACVRRKVISTWWLPWAGSAGFPGAGKSVSELGDDIVFAKLAA